METPEVVARRGRGAAGRLEVHLRRDHGRDDPDDRAAVAAVQERRHKGQLQGLAIKLHDENAALVTLCRHLGLFNQQAVSQKHLNALLDGMASVLQRYVDPGRVKEAILELTRIAQDSYARLEGPG